MEIIEFDKNGFLTPYDLIETLVDNLKTYFVDSMKEYEWRNTLLNSYFEYNKKLMSVIKTDYVQWINGSFVTKALKPNDIDIVSFINYSIVKQHIQELQNLIFPLSFDNYKMDAYMVRTFPETHDKYSHTRSDSLYWLHHFLKTKPDKRNRTFSKGFIKIQYKYEK